jgi:hypothetical protein
MRAPAWLTQTSAAPATAGLSRFSTTTAAAEAPKEEGVSIKGAVLNGRSMYLDMQVRRFAWYLPLFSFR